MAKFGRDVDPRQWLGKTGLAHNRSVPVIAPEGVFESMTAAAAANGMTHQAIQWKLARSEYGNTRLGNCRAHQEGWKKL